MNKRQLALEFLGNECVRCLTTENLHFDHINPDAKLFNISGARMSIAKLLSELKKCQLLCRKCHGKKTREQNKRQYTLVHGKVNSYVNHKCRCDLCKETWRKYCYSKTKHWNGHEYI